MAGTNVVATKDSLDGSTSEEVRNEFNKAVADIEVIRKWLQPNQVLPNQTAGAGWSVDADAVDIETDNAIYASINGIVYSLAAISALNTADTAANASTVAQDKWGAFWLFQNGAGGGDVEVAVDAQTFTSAIIALSQWAKATNTLPPGADDVCSGVLYMQENNSGVFTFGTDSITAETETYVDFLGLPGIESIMASFALDANAATFTYGAAVGVLGSRVRISFTGKANVTIAGSAIKPGKVGAWLFYGLADDVEYALQLGNDYASLAAAKLAVRDHNHNPYLVLLGAIFVKNASTADFTPGTTKFDAAGISSTFTKMGVGTRPSVDMLAAKVLDYSGNE